MPQTPRVRFNFKNLNVQSSVPLLGVINVVARTTKGPFEDPKDLIANSLTVHSHLRFGNSSGWFGIKHHESPGNGCKSPGITSSWSWGYLWLGKAYVGNIGFFSGSSLGIGTRRFFGYFHYYIRPEWG